MDKELIEGLSNLSNSLDKISEALSKKGEAKSASATALQMGNFDKQIKEISQSIIEVKKDTQKLLDQQDTILKILKKKERDSKSDIKKEKVKTLPTDSTPVKVSKEKTKEKEDKTKDDSKVKKIPNGKTTEEVAKEKKDGKKDFFGDMDSKKIKDGVATILTIAVGVIAIGLALKIVGKIDFLSVMTLALALPLIAIAFTKIASVFQGQEVDDGKGKKIKTNKINLRDLPAVILGMVGFSTAIAASSWILSKVKPVGLFQAMTSILIAGTFAVLSPNLGKIISAFNRVGLFNALKAAAFLPIVMLGISTAIMLSSYVLSKVKPIGLFQAITSILIAGTFAVMSYGLGKLISAFRGIDPFTALVASALMPIVLVAVSVSIALSSYFLSKVKPIGLFQALTAIMIGATFAVISFGIGKIISAFKGINPLTALAAAEIMPILFVALSISIMISSYFLSKVRPIGLFQALSSIFISAVFVVLSYGVAKIIKSFRGLSILDIENAVVAMPVIFTALSIAILASSYLLSKVKPIDFSQFLTSVGISLLFVVFAYSMKLIVKAVKNINPEDAVSAGLMMIGWTTVVAIAGFIISKMPDISLGKIIKFTLLSLALVGITVVMALAIEYLSKVHLKDIIKGGLVIVAIATVISLSSIILNFGKYDKYPSLKWAIGVGLTMVAFGLAALALGTIITATAGLGAIAIASGLIAVLAIAGTIVAVDKIISTGQYSKYPGLKWALGVGGTLVGFAAAVVTLGVINSVGGIASTLTFGVVKNPIDAGAEAVIKIAKLIPLVDRIISSGQYNKYPGVKWSLGVGGALTAFATAVVVLGALNSGGGLVQKLTLGLVKNPIDSGINVIKKIAEAIVDVDKILSGGKYSGGPNATWSKGISLALSAFSPIYVMLMKDKIMSIFGKGISIKEFSDAIKTISQGIVDSANLFGKSNTSFKNGPPVEWANGVSKALSAFSPIYTLLMKNAGWFKSGVSPKQFVGAIRTITHGIVDSAKIFSKSKSSFSNYPSLKWSEGVSKSLQAFAPIFEYLNKNKSFLGSLFGSDPSKDLNKAIVGIADALVNISFRLSKGKFNSYISDDFVKGLDKSYNFIVGIYPKIKGLKIEKIEDNLIKTANLIRNVSLRLSTINFKNVITDTFIKGMDKTSNSILRLGQLAIDLDKRFGMAKLFLGLIKAKSISNAIKDISLNLDKGKYTKFPSLEWAKGVPIAIASFMTLPFKGVLSQVADFILGPSEDSKKSQLAKVVDMMLFVDRKLQSGNWKKFPTVNWVNGTILAIQKFRQMVSLLSFSSLGDKITQAFGFKNPIVSALSNIEMLAVSFDKLAKSVKKFTDSIKSIDAEKLSAIRGLSSNIIMMSLMDPEQFDSMMTKLEERSGVFADLLKDFDSKKSETSKSGGGVNFKPATEAKNQKTDFQILGEKIDLMNALLSDISSVVGSRGALKNYLNKMKDDVTIGGTSNSLNQRSDSRLKNVIKKLYVSDSGINVYLFSYKFDPSTLYQGVIAQELLNTPYESALHMDKNGLYSVDYSQIDVDFKKTNFT